MNKWLKSVRNKISTKDWWKILAAKLSRHFVYGVSENYASLLVLPSHAPPGEEEAQPPQPETQDERGAVYGLPPSLPAAETEDDLHSFYPFHAQ